VHTLGIDASGRNYEVRRTAEEGAFSRRVPTDR